MERNIKVLAVILVLSLIIACQSLYLYLQYKDFRDLTEKHALLQEDFTALQKSHWMLEVEHETLQLEHKTLISEHDSLKSEHSTLQSEYNKLSTDYKALESDYNSLEIKYKSLDSKYQKLFSDYQLLNEAFNKPLKYKKTPTVTELQIWLMSDTTNSVRYSDPNFICGDFAVMLAMHAKTKNWDMTVVVVYGYDADTDEDFAHAFNAIRTTEGLVYIEPQTDEVWYYEDYREIYATSRIKWGFPNDQWIIIEDYIIVLQY